MLATRIIPTILSKNGLLVKGEGFKCDRPVGNAIQAARIHSMRGVDEIMLLDVTATKDGREPDYDMVRNLSKGCYVPLTVGGGIKTADHVRKLLQAGADKVLIGFDKVLLISDFSNKFGRQCISVSIDAFTNYKLATACAVHAENEGAGEVLLQSVERDGTMKGYDIDLIESVSSAVSVPVIASGGCSGYEDMYNAIKAGASAVAAGALFQFTDCTPKGAAMYLHSRGIEVRL